MAAAMPKKIRKAIGAVKDQTSISLAKVSSTNATKLEVLILRATTHDEIPIDERYVNDILQLVSSNKVYAAACAQALSKRIGRTRNWIVALKSLMLVLRTFQDGDPHFPREVLHAMKRGAKILNLSSFRDDSNSSPWDYTAFVRTFALYLDERIDCFLTGKLQRRFTNRSTESSTHQSSRLMASPVRDMKPAMLLDKISYWQRLLDRAIGTRPTGAAKSNRLVLNSLYAIVVESFDLYRDISDGLALLLDSFFHLQYHSCVKSFQACVKFTKQLEELSSFYNLCKAIGLSALPTKDDPASSVDEKLARDDQSEESMRVSSRRARRSGFSSRCTSLEDLMSLTEPGKSLFTSAEQGCYSEEQLQKQSPRLEDFFRSGDRDYGSNRSFSLEQGSYSCFDLLSLDNDWLKHEEKLEQQQQQLGHETSETSDLEPDRQSKGWELVLFESATQHEQPSTNLANGFEPSVVKDMFSQASHPQHQYNPFLQDEVEVPAILANAPASATNEPAVFLADNTFSLAPTFHAAGPTFCVQIETEAAPTFCAKDFEETTTVAPTFRVPNSTQTSTEAPTHVSANNYVQMLAADPNKSDPFESYCPVAMGAIQNIPNGSMNEESLLHEQRMWLEHQNKIIAKRMS
ncbi:hypothetical protein I3842_04G109300 [Carya illinoinensis]|uniref:ENTH domain-containing protein n=1 Tax=Carya illinoinensis TaxID=32201 RepID=A0A922F7H9_CARIL|nr:hypothetical protein I3842_04G109300 [Carya illinoinensis]